MAPSRAAFPAADVAADGYIAPTIRFKRHDCVRNSSNSLRPESHETIVVLGIGLLYHVEALQERIARQLRAWPYRRTGYT